jgi:hypothetical protein
LNNCYHYVALGNCLFFWLNGQVATAVYACGGWFCQGILTERDGSVQLTSSLRQLILFI